MKNLNLLFLFLLLFSTSVLKSQIYSFEDNLVPTGWTTSSLLPLEISTLKRKNGLVSLKWNWDAASIITASNPNGLSVASTGGGGIYLWVYNTSASTTNKLKFAFLNSSNQQKCVMNVNLNFVGWRCITASFATDMGHDNSALTQMVIQAPATGSGTFYFDHIEFITSANVKWDRMSDAQYSVTQSTAVFDFWGIRGNGNFTTVPTATSSQTIAADTITKRLDNWFVSTQKFVSSPVFLNRKTALTADVSAATGTTNLKNYFKLLPSAQPGTEVTGEGLYPENTSTVNGVAVKNFRDVSEGILLWLAYDYKLNPTKTDSKTRWINLIDYYNDQGWADGSAMAGLMGEKLRSSGYFNSVFMMRNELDTARLSRELKTLNWFGLWGNVNMPFATLGENADQIRTMCIAKLAYALMQPDPNKRVVALTGLTKYFNNSFAIAPGFLETFKPDFSGYHHSGTYMTQYYPDALYTASWVYYLLHDTPYALSDDVYNTLKNCLLTYRMLATLYDVPVSTCGRFPSGTRYVNAIVPAYAYLALSKSTPDPELLAAFGRLWKPTVSPLLDNIKSTDVGISHKTSLGEIELCLSAAAFNQPAEASPKASVYLPYSGLMINRSSNRHVAIKGFSKFIWDYETDGSNNAYGRYLSYGQIECTNLNTNRRNSSYGIASWDWRRIPGTTTKNISNTELKYVAGAVYRSFSDQSFLGGIALNDSISMFSMMLHDNAYDKTFYANKSVFCFGNALVCLGSNINDSSKLVRTETTLFQQVVKAGEILNVNGAASTATQTNLTQAFIKDNIGNSYIVKSTSPVDVIKKDSMYTAVINHGFAPVNQTYNYIMLQQSTTTQDTKYSNPSTCPISIIRQDNVAHIIKNSDENIYAYSIFNINSALNDTWIKQVNIPSMAMLKINGNGTCKLIVSDPDMHRASVQNTGSITDAVEASPSAPFNYEIVLNGQYSLDGLNPGVVLTNNGSIFTTIAVTVVDGKSYTIGLRSNSTSSIQGTSKAQSLSIFTSENKNVFNVNSSENENMNMTVNALSGKCLRSFDNRMSPFLLDLNDLQKGIYIVTAKTKTDSLNKKLIVE